MAMESAEPDPWRHLAGLQQAVDQTLPHAQAPADLLLPFLNHLAHAGPCLGGLVWRTDAARIGLIAQRFRNPDLDRHNWPVTLAALATVDPDSPRCLSLSTGGPPHWLVVVPLRTGDLPPAHLGAVFASGADPGQTRPDQSVSGSDGSPAGEGPPGSWVDFACAAAELATLYLVRQQRDQLVRRQQRAEVADARVDSLYAPLAGAHSPADLLAAVQTALGADRAWLFELAGETARLRASSLPRVDSHADRQLTVLAQLAGRVAGQREPLRAAAGEGPPGDDPTNSLLLEYLDLSRNRRVELLPLPQVGSEPPAVLVLDHFTGPERAEEPTQRDRLLGHVARSWSVMRQRGLGGWRMRVARWLGLDRETARGRRVAAMAGGAVLLLLCPWRFEIMAEADLEPGVQRRVFAPADGVVQRVLTRDGEDVASGQLLLELDSTPLQAKRSEIETSLQTQRVRLQALQSARGRRAGGRDELSGTAAGELEETRRAIEGHEAQLALLQTELASLSVRSPIAGRVDQFDLEQRLLRRPISRGQELLRVEQQAGPWRLRVRIPESESGHVAAALRQRGPLAARFQFVTDPGQTRRGELASLADRAETDLQGRLWVRGEVPVDPVARAGHRAGSGAVVRVDCGWRSLGFVLFREVRELLARWWW